MTSIITIHNQEELFSPPTLQDLCLLFCSSNAKKVLLAQSNKKQETLKNKRKLQKCVHLPSHIWEHIIEHHDRFSDDFMPLIWAVVKSRKNFFLRKIHVCNSPKLQDDELQLLMANFPTSLDIHNCPVLTKRTVSIINQFGRNLECLCIGNSTHIIPTDIEDWMSKTTEEKPQGIRKFAQSITRFFKGKSLANQGITEYEALGLLHTPKLKKLIIWGHHTTQIQQPRQKNSSESGGGDNDNRITVDYWEYLTREFIDKLEYLDLSSCQEIIDLHFLLQAKGNLRSLHLHDVLLDYDEKTWGVLKNLTELKFLDVSQYIELASVFSNPDSILDSIVSNLPKLVGLDISGTNLAGFEPDRSSVCGIMGLKSRQKRPFHFLGLLATHYNACTRKNIPAILVAGGKTIKHILVSLQHYVHRPNIIKKVIRMLHELIQRNDSEDFVPLHTILRLLIQAMKPHLEDKHTQIVSMAALFHVIKKIHCNESSKLCTFQANEIFSLLLKAMELHNQDLSLLRNGVLNLLMMVPSMTMSADMKETLLFVLFKVGKAAISNSESFILKSVVFLLKTTISSMDKRVKNTFGDMGVIEKLCKMLEEMCSNNNTLDQTPVCWTLLWNLTEDCPRNCESFVEADGVEVGFKFIRICAQIPDTDARKAMLSEAQIPVFEILKNLLSNPNFQSIVITPEHINDALYTLDKRLSDNEQLCFHLCGFLCKVVTMKQAYSIGSPSRQEILRRILKTMRALNCYREFSYSFRRLSPLYDLLETDAPEIHVWALWTLVNLTKTDPKKYVNLILLDGYIQPDKLHERFYSQDYYKCNEELKKLCTLLVDNIKSHLSSSSIAASS